MRRPCHRNRPKVSRALHLAHAELFYWSHLSLVTCGSSEEGLEQGARFHDGAHARPAARLGGAVATLGILIGLSLHQRGLRLQDLFNRQGEEICSSAVCRFRGRQQASTDKDSHVPAS